MDNVDERDPRVACDATPEICALDVEVVTAEERRHVFESLGNAALDPRVAIDRRLLDALGHEVVEPRGEIFEGEGEALLAVLVDEQDGHIFAARVLAQAVIEVAACPDEGTRAGRVALLRCVAGFLLHDRCSRTAARLRQEGLTSA
jgi:hypothetical protein